MLHTSKTYDKVSTPEATMSILLGYDGKRMYSVYNRRILTDSHAFRQTHDIYAEMVLRTVSPSGAALAGF